MSVMFRVMFYSPRIAPNTGNAIRLVAATGSELHLVQPLGFDLSEPKLRRAGLDYDARRHLIRCHGRREVGLPFAYLGADRAGPNYTGQPAVHSYYEALS